MCSFLFDRDPLVAQPSGVKYPNSKSQFFFIFLLRELISFEFRSLILLIGVSKQFRLRQLFLGIVWVACLSSNFGSQLIVFFFKYSRVSFSSSHSMQYSVVASKIATCLLSKSMLRHFNYTAVNYCELHLTLKISYPKEIVRKATLKQLFLILKLRRCC